MGKKKTRDNLINWLIALGCIIFAALVNGLYFDYFYDLNDDVLIKDIISGAYTGTPEAHNIQIYYMLSRFISKFYKHFPKVPWYGLFLCIFQYGSVLIIVNRCLKLFVHDEDRATDDVAGIKVLHKVKDILLKIFTALSLTVMLMALMLSHVINLQYTITVAYLAAAAVMWFLTSDSDTRWDIFHLRNFPAIVLLFIAFLLRSEMLLLMLPFVGAAGIIKWSFEKKIFTRENFVKYLFIFATIFLSMGIGLLVNLFAFRSTEWKTFNKLFDARTELYDFQVIPQYEGNEEFYEGLGLGESEVRLFENYNYGIDSKIDEKTMLQVADYAGKLNKDNTPFKDKLVEKVRFYIYRLTHGPHDVGSDFPWNYCVIVLYFEVLLLLILSKRWGQIIDLVILFGLRSVSWMYILMGERDPERITHSLYLVEMVVLLGFLVILLKDITKRMNKGKAFPILGFALVCVFCGYLGLTDGIYAEELDMAKREEVNEPYIELYEYTSSHPENFYLMDVYSSVAYSEKVFDQRVKALDKKNVDLLGGWAYGSPLQKKKITEIVNAVNAVDAENRTFEDILLNDNNVYLIASNEDSLDWLTEYYEKKGISISIKPYVDTDYNSPICFGKLCIYEIGR